MKILIFITVWKRPEITKLCLQGIRRLQKYKPEWNIEPLFIISEDWAEEWCEKEKLAHCWTENEPLGRKMNLGIEVAMELDFTHLMFFNSDTIIANELLDIYEPYFEGKEKAFGEPIEFFGIDKVHFIDREGKRAKLVDYSFTLCGAAKVISRKFIEKYAYRVKIKWLDSYSGNHGSWSEGETTWAPLMQAEEMERKGMAEIMSKPKYTIWDADRSSTIDHQFLDRILFTGRQVPNKCIDIGMKPLAFDIKSDINIWAYDSIKGDSVTQVDFDEVVKNIPEINAGGKIRQANHLSVAHKNA